MINLANLYYINQDLNKAEALYLKSLNEKADNIGVVVNLIRLYLAMGDKINAKNYYSKATKLNINYLTNHSDLVKLLK